MRCNRCGGMTYLIFTKNLICCPACGAACFAADTLSVHLEGCEITFDDKVESSMAPTKAYSIVVGDEVFVADHLLGGILSLNRSPSKQVQRAFFEAWGVSCIRVPEVKDIFLYP